MAHAHISLHLASRFESQTEYERKSEQPAGGRRGRLIAQCGVWTVVSVFRLYFHFHFASLSHTWPPIRSFAHSLARSFLFHCTCHSLFHLFPVTSIAATFSMADTEANMPMESSSSHDVVHRDPQQASSVAVESLDTSSSKPPERKTRSYSRSRSRSRSRSYSRSPRHSRGRPLSDSRSRSRSRSRPRSRSSSRSRSDSYSRSSSRSRSRSQSRSRSRSLRRSRSRYSEPKVTTKLFVRGLSKNVTDEHLKEIFGHYGTIKTVELPMNRQGKFALSLYPSPD